MGLSWQQGPLAPGAVGHFLTDQPLPDRLLFAEPARRRMRIRFDDTWIADSEQAILLHEPGRYPVAYLPIEHVEEGVLLPADRITTHRDLGATRWFTVAGPAAAPNGQPGPTQTCPSTHRCSPGTSRSHGVRWTASTKKTNAFSDTPPTTTTASISARAPATSSSARQEGPSPTQPHPSSSTNRASRRAGTCPVRTSTRPH